MAQLADNLNDASILLDGYKRLSPANKKDFEAYYVKRPVHTSTLIREATAAVTNNRPFHWFFTGHTGAGKSTELNKLLVELKGQTSGTTGLAYCPPEAFACAITSSAKFSVFFSIPSPTS